MTLRQLQYFVAVVDAGLNITLAAERVHATQPGISKQLKQLEGAFGFDLFLRRGKSVEALTEPGRQLLPRARQIVETAQALRAQARVLAGETGRQLRIGASPSAARHLLPPALANLERGIRDLEVTLLVTDTSDAIEQLRRGILDLAVGSTTVDRPPATRAVPLSRWRRVALLPSAHPLARSDANALALADLARYPLVTYSSAQQSESSFQRTFAERGLQPRIALAAADGELIRAYVRGGLGIGIVAPSVVDELDDPELRVMPIEAGLPACVTWLLLPPDGELSPEAQALVAALGLQPEQIEAASWGQT
ncbi:MAG: LysR family transcriptional regulator [Xanthomonadales bacterium]|nr:LysR family transcriptional regulator [Xanthomonadales bacterium]MCB1628302.1 LysR family transcriptional regulator [Xanthomonadales bacterium]